MAVPVGYIVGGVSLFAFGSYVIASVVLFKFPHLIHKRKESKFRAVHISHRGGKWHRGFYIVYSSEKLLFHVIDG